LKTPTSRAAPARRRQIFNDLEVKGWCSEFEARNAAGRGLAPTLLKSRDLVRDFYLQRLNPDGGFQDRAGERPLLHRLRARGAGGARHDARPRLPRFSRASARQDLDFVHLTCLARVGDGGSFGAAAPCRGRDCPNIEAYRSRDGGCSVAADAEFGTPCGAFLALGAIEDLKGAPSGRIACSRR
jgi:hypothetical protein